MKRLFIICAATITLSCAGVLRADDLTVAAGTPVTISESRTYDTITVNGSLTISGSGVAVTATTVLVAEGVGETGTLTVTDGASLTVTGVRSGSYYPFSVAHPSSASGSGESHGVVNVLNGATVTTHDLLVANMDGCDSNTAIASLNITNATVTVQENFWTTRGNYSNYDGSWYPAIVNLGENATLAVRQYTRNGASKTLFRFGGGAFRYHKASSLDWGTIVMEGDGHAIDLDVNNRLDTWSQLGAGSPVFVLQNRGNVQLVGNGGLKVTSVVSLDVSSTTDLSTSHSRLQSSYAGPLTLNLPSLRQMAAKQVCTGTNALVLASAQGASFDLNGIGAEFPSVSMGAGGGCVCNSSATVATLTVGADDSNGMLQTLAGPIAIRKVGSGAWTVNADDLQGVTVDGGSLTLLSPSATGYRYWRFFPTAVYGTGTTIIQAAELDFLDAGGVRQLDFLRTEGTFDDTNCRNIFDANFGTKCLSLDIGEGKTVAAVFATPRVVTSYRWATADDYGPESKKGGLSGDYGPPSYDVTMCRDPKDWTVSASNDGINWRIMDMVNGFKATNTRKTYNPTNFVCTYPDRLLTGPVSVAASATLNIGAGTLAPTAWNAYGTVNFAEGCTYAIGGTEDVTFRNISDGATVEKSGSGDVRCLGGTFTGRVHVAAGTLALSGRSGISGKYWRWRLKKLRSDSTDAFNLQRFALYDISGTRVNLGSSGTVVSGLSLAMYNGSMSSVKSSFENLFTGSDSDASGFVFVERTSGGSSLKRPNPEDESTWSGVVFKLPDETADVYSYGMMTAVDHPDRDPVSWDLAVSDDGVAWTVVSDEADAVAGQGRRSWNEYNGGSPFFFDIPVDAAMLAPGTDVQVDAGATLAFVGAATVLDTLTVDCSAGGGTISHFNPAAHGTLNLVNVAGGTDVTAIDLLALGTVANAANLGGWTVTVDGVARNYYISAANGVLRLCKKGMVLVVR